MSTNTKEQQSPTNAQIELQICANPDYLSVVRTAVRQLFADAAGDGNYLFNLGATADEARHPENVRAMFAEAKRLSGRGEEA